MAMYPSKKKPSGNVDLGEYTSNGTYTGKAVSGKATASFTVNVPHPTHTTTYTPAQNKSNNDMGATHSYRYVDTSGMYTVSGTKDNSGSAYTANGTYTISDLTSYSGVKIAINVPHPTHTTTYTPAANTAANDMGATHSYRYVNTSGMIVPSGTKDNSGSAYTSNGTYTISDLGSYTGVKIAINVPSVTLSGDAATGNVLSGKTFYSNSTTKQTGTMTNNGAWTSTGVTANATTTKNVTIPAGYHNGSGYVQLASLSSQTGVESGKTAAAAGQILSGYQAWVNGARVTGSISSKAAATYNTSTSDQTISSGQYLSGNQTIKAVTTSGISAANIKSGTTVTVGDSNSSTRIANVTGTFTSSSTVSSGQTAAAAAQIKYGYSAWVNGSEVKGSYTEPSINNITPSNTSPVVMSVSSNYKITTNSGYAIQSYQSKTPDTSGVAFDAGIVKMSQGGYAYSEKPASGFVETTLWTNSVPSDGFVSQTITLSQSIRNFEFLKIYYETNRSERTDCQTASVIWPVDDFISKISGDGRTGFYIGTLGCPGVDGNYWRARRFTYTSDTTIDIDAARALGKNHVTSLVVIPLKIIGLNFA